MQFPFWQGLNENKGILTARVSPLTYLVNHGYAKIKIKDFEYAPVLAAVLAYTLIL